MSRREKSPYAEGASTGARTVDANHHPAHSTSRGSTDYLKIPPFTPTLRYRCITVIISISNRARSYELTIMKKPRLFHMTLL